jgi:VWFA-related protein
MRFSRVLLPSVLALIPILTTAQNRERTTVEVVQVPVSVTADGSSVRGLTREDFTLKVNGKSQAIDYFDVIDFAALSNEQLRDPRQRRLYVLTFDLPNTSPISAFRAQRAAEQYLANAQPSDYFAVALVDRYGNINFIVPFTRDRDALRRAVTTFRAASPKDPLRLTVTPAERAVLTFDQSPEIEQLRHTGANVAAEQMLEANRNRLADELDALGELALRLAPLEGYKHVLLLSGGFDEGMLVTRFTPATLRNSIALQLGGNGTGRDPIRFDSRVPFAQQQMQKNFAAAGVFLDAVDVSGLRAYDAPYRDSLHFLIADTGGQVVEHRNDLAAAMKRLTDSQQVVYLLGFRAPQTGRRENRISVRVSGTPRGSNVAYRESYPSTPDKPSSNDGLRLADIIINDIPQNGITMTTSVATAAQLATVHVTLPGRELAAIAGSDAKIKGDALIYVFAGQKAVAFAQTEIDATVAKAANVDIAQSFDLPPGTYAMKVLVRLENDTLAFARKDFTVGE